MISHQELIFWTILFVAAVLEVGGDALIRIGEQSKGFLLIIPGAVVLGLYGVFLNLLSGPEWISYRFKIDLSKVITMRISFSMLLGVYISVFAVVSIIGNALFSKDKIPYSTWLGGAIVLLGGLVIRYSGCVE